MSDDPGIGHNQPPAPLHADQLLDWLELHVVELRTRRTALLEAAGRLNALLPISDEDMAGNAAEFVRQMRAWQKTTEELRTLLGAPYRDCTATLNAFFARLRDPVSSAQDMVTEALSEFARAKARREAERRKAEADRRRAEAEQAEREAQLSDRDAAWDRAVDTAERADKATKRAAAPVADLSRVRGDQGAVASLREHWDWQVVDESAIPRLYLIPDQVAIRAAIAGGIREIPGLRIYDASKVAVR